MSLVSGHYLGTGQISVVYMLPFGEGNVINPYFFDRSSGYNIPVLLLISCRGKHSVPTYKARLARQLSCAGSLSSLAFAHRSFS